MTNLGELPEATSSAGTELNAAGRVVGNSTALGVDFSSAVIADRAIGMHGLGTLGGLESWAADINDAGEVVGRSSTGPVIDDWWAFRAFLWRDGVMHDLGALPGDEYSCALAINASSDVVGWSRAGFFTGSTCAVLWRDGVAIDLNATLPPGSGWTLSLAADINASGVIIGSGTWNGEPRPFVLTPRP
jgi:probable HAF family extracellular repeat protein